MRSCFHITTFKAIKYSDCDCFGIMNYKWWPHFLAHPVYSQFLRATTKGWNIIVRRLEIQSSLTLLKDLCIQKVADVWTIGPTLDACATHLLGDQKLNPLNDWLKNKAILQHDAVLVQNRSMLWPLRSALARPLISQLGQGQTVRPGSAFRTMLY